MGTAYFYDSYSDQYNDDLTIAKGLSTVSFNPGGDPLGAEVEEVRFRLHLDHNAGTKVDLGKIDMWIVSPDGEKNNIYYNWDGFGADGDDGNDSDASDDYDISFWGTDLKSSILFGLDGNPVNGNWGLRIDNQTGITLDLNYLEVWVEYNAAPDLRIKDIDISGTRKVGSPVLIEAWIENLGDQFYGGKVDIEYLVNGEVIGTSILPLGLGGGVVNYETDLHVFDKIGSNTVEVRIVDSDDLNTSNDSRTESFSFAVDDRPDLTVTDIRVLGGWEKGDTIEVRTFIENIGTESWNLLKGPINVEYIVDGVSVGTDKLSWGLTPLFGDWESFDYTLKKDGPHIVEVKVSGADPELSTSNNSWSEEFGHDHDTGTQKTLANSAFEVKLGAFMARTVYGMENVPENVRSTSPLAENGLMDDYRGYLNAAGWTVLDDSNGLGGYFRAKDGKAFFSTQGLYIGDAEDINIFTSFAAQGLVAVGMDPEGKKTLALTFRGTDDKDALDAALGQAYTGNGIYNYYEAMRPLIDAAIGYANDDGNGIDKVVVSGHSLGGATVDLFTLVDAHRLQSDLDLTIVSLASAGLHPKAFLEDYKKNGMAGQYDTRLVRSLDQSLSNDSVVLDAPKNYIGLSFTNDPVTFDHQNPTSLPLVTNATLSNNKNFETGLQAIDLPNVSMTDPTETFKLGGFGAEHNQGLYWAIISMVADDPLVDKLNGHRLIAGETDYSAVSDFGGTAFEVFGEYMRAKDENYENDAGRRALIGSGSDDYILGLSGHDALKGKGGDDLLSGDAGDDTILGGAGGDNIDGGADNDTLDGGRGADLIAGGQGADTLNGRGGADRLSGGAGDDTLVGARGADSLFGGKGRDQLNGAKGQDLLVGGRGKDWLDGGAGNDVLRGGAGKDSFVFSSGSGRDVIQGFQDDTDTIALAESLWGGGLNKRQVLTTYGTETGPDILLDFGKDELLLRDVADLLALRDDIAFI